MRRNRLLYAGWLKNLSRFKRARPNHVRVESSCCYSKDQLLDIANVLLMFDY